MGDSVYPPIWTRRFVVLLLINVIVSFAQFMTLALVPKLAHEIGATAVVVGIVTGVFAITSLAVRPGVGWATLRVRHNHLLIGTVVLIGVAFVLYACSDSIPMLVVARLIHGAAMGFLAPVTLAMASDALPPTRMAQGIGIFSLGQAVATALGPSAGLWLLAQWGYRPSFLIGAGLSLVAAAIALTVRSPAPVRHPGFRFGWRTFIAVEAIVPAAVILLLSGAYSGVNAFIVLYGEARGVEQMGLFFTTYAVVILLSRPIAGRIADRRGLAVVVIPGMVMFALAFVVISQAQTLFGFLLAAAVAALGYGICQPAIQTLCLIAVEPSRRGVASNTNYLGVDLGYLIMPILAGGIVTARVDAGADAADAYSMMYLFLIAPVVLGLIVFVVFGRGLLRRTRGPHPIEPEL